MNFIFNICFAFFNLTSNQFPSHRESLYLSFLFNTLISNIDNILTFGWWRVNNEGTQIWTRVEKREKNGEYILVKDMEGLNGKNEYTRIEIFSQKGNDKKIIIFFPFWSFLILKQLWRKPVLRWKSFWFVGFKFFFWQTKIDRCRRFFSFLTSTNAWLGFLLKVNRKCTYPLFIERTYLEDLPNECSLKN